MKKFSDLQFELLTTSNCFNLIPRYLFEQIKNRDWEVDKIYEYGPIFLCNPLNRVWALTDIAHVIKGVLWMTIDPVVEVMCVNVLSVDPEYQRPAGAAIKAAKEHLLKFRAELKEQGGHELKETILYTTTRPKAFERAGARRYKRTIMEI